MGARALIDAVQRRLGANPLAMRLRRETVEPFGTMKARMGATHFLQRNACKVTAEMAPVLAYNLIRVMNTVADSCDCGLIRAVRLLADFLEGCFTRQDPGRHPHRKLCCCQWDHLVQLR